MASATAKFLPLYFTSFLLEIASKHSVFGVKGNLQLPMFLLTLTWTKASFLYWEITQGIEKDQASVGCPSLLHMERKCTQPICRLVACVAGALFINTAQQCFEPFPSAPCTLLSLHYMLFLSVIHVCMSISPPGLKLEDRCQYFVFVTLWGLFHYSNLHSMHK